VTADRINWPQVVCGACRREMRFQGVSERTAWVYRCMRCKIVVRLVDRRSLWASPRNQRLASPAKRRHRAKRGQPRAQRVGWRSSRRRDLCWWRGDATPLLGRPPSRTRRTSAAPRAR